MQQVYSVTITLPLTLAAANLTEAQTQAERITASSSGLATALAAGLIAGQTSDRLCVDASSASSIPTPLFRAMCNECDACLSADVRSSRLIAGETPDRLCVDAFSASSIPMPLFQAMCHEFDACLSPDVCSSRHTPQDTLCKD